MNIQFNNWQLIDLNALDTGITSALTEFDNLLNPFDSFAIMPPGVETNTQITGIWINPFIGASFNVDLRGNHFLDDVPIETVTSLSLIEANPAGFNRNLLVTGSVTYNYDNGLYSGSLKKLSYTSTNVVGLTNLLIEGTFNVDPTFGEFAGGTATKYNITFSGNTLNMAGSIKLNATDDIIGGTISSFSFIDNLGHSFFASGLTLNALDFYTLTDPLFHSNLTSLFTLVNDPTKLTGNDTITGGDGNDTINGFAGNDSLDGGNGDDTLSGGAGNDTLNGGLGIDSLIGGDGADTYFVDISSDVVQEDSALAIGGIDLVKSTANTYTLSANVENLTLIGLAANNIGGLGNALANTIIGDDGNNQLEGLDGNDTISGGLGNDSLLGGAGNDNLSGGIGNDTLIGGLGVDLLAGGLGDDTYEIDLIKIGVGATASIVLQDTVSGEAADSSTDTIVLTNTSGIDLSTPNYITRFTLATYIENLDASAITFTNFYLSLTGNTLNNTIIGNDVDNSLTGLGGDDSLVGGAGDDFLNGGLGVDTLKGGSGNDRYLIDSIIADVIDEEGNTDAYDAVDYVVNASNTLVSALTVGVNNINTVQLTPTTTASLNLTNIESLSVFGTGNYNLFGNANSNVLEGNAANNLIDGGGGNDYLVGGAGLDTLIGGAGDDTYTADSLAEINLINDIEGNNTLQATFSYTLTNTSSFNNIWLYGAIAANATGNDFDNILHGNDAANMLSGGLGADQLHGGFGNDTLNGGLGADWLVGDDGNDTYVVDTADTMLGNIVIAAGDIVTEWGTGAAGGIDIVLSSVSFDLLNTTNGNIRDNIENLTLTGTAISATGNALANTLTGNAGDNILNGGLGNDTLNGGDGNDSLTGGAGVDALTGGKGDDTYFIDLVRVSALPTSTIALQDTVSELANAVGSTAEGIDTIVLTNLTGNAGVPIDTSNIINATTLALNANVENIDALGNGITTGTGSIKLNLTGNALANNIIGNDANNILDGGLSDGKQDTLAGGLGDDTYVVDIFASGLAPNVIVNLQDIVVEGSSNANGIDDTVKLRGILAPTNATLISLTGSLGNIENLDVSLTATTKLNLMGSDAANKLTGNAADNIINGGIGDDTMAGGAGNDVYLVDGSFEVITELLNAGIDTVQSSTNFSLLDTDYVGVNGGNIENLTLTGLAVYNTMGTGNALNNLIIGDDGNNQLFGLGGSDTLIGGLGIDLLIGGDGNDTYEVDETSDAVQEDSALAAGGIDTVRAKASFTLSTNVENLTLIGLAANNISGTGNSLNNIIIGDDGNNILSGDAGNDNLSGGLGDDTLIGDAGIDILNGGLGNDTYVVDMVKLTAASATLVLQDTITEALNAGTDNIILRGGTIATTATTLLTLGANIEGLDARGDNATTGTGTTKLNITGNTLDNTLRGNDADNIIDGGIGNDFLRAYDGSDSLLGGAGDDLLDGDSGNDTLDGGVGVDQLQGDQGDDTYIIDIIASGTGVNTTAVLEDNIFGDAVGVDTLKLRGSITTTNASIINLGQIIQFVGDSNRYSIENADATLTGTTKLDLIGSNQDNNIIGNAANNNMTGEAGNDTLSGAAGNDTLSGGIGNDSLDGGIGTDTMDGGEGDDTYVLDVITDSIINETNTSGIDTVRVAFTANLFDAKFNNIENLILTGAAVNGTGNTLVNDITGNDGANTLDGGLDSVADTLRGGKGNDIYILRAGDTVIENLNEGTDLIRTALSFDLLLANNVENLTLLNVSNLGNIDPLNNINAFGNDLANILTGNDGDNSFIGAAGADTLIGGKGNDRYNVNLKLTGIQGTASAVVSLEDTIVESALVTDGLEDALSLVGTFNLTNASTITLAVGLEYLFAENTGSTRLNLTGNSANNIIQGNDADNTIDGAAGADTLTGFKGNDTYIVDIIATGTGLQDTIFEEFGTNGSTDGIDTLKLRGNLVIPAPAALTYDLTTIGNGNLENIDASLTGTTRINLTGNAENNFLTGNAANNTLNGGDNDDTLNGGLGNDSMSGGDGNDIYIVDSTLDITTETNALVAGGIDEVKSSISFDLSTKGANIEKLTLTGAAVINATGNDLANTITGNAAANILDGGTGADSMDGGDGADTYIVDNIGDTVTETNAVTATGGIDTVKSSALNFTLSNNLENIILTGTGDINGTGNALANTITGNSGRNILDGGLGADTMIGGAGNDIYIVDNTGDTIIEIAPPIQDNLTMFDIIQTSISYTASNNVEKMFLTGTDNINGSTNNIFGTEINGNIGNNILKGGAGFDTLIGGAGNDTYITTLFTSGYQNLPAFPQTTVAIIQDTIFESINGGIDTLILSGSIAVPTGRILIATNLAGSPNQPAYLIFNNGITQNIENVDISQTGATLIDIDGNDDANKLTGNSAANILIGNAGNDTLDGGLGNDTLNGGIGNDTYVLNVVTDIITGETDGNDTAEVAFTASLTDAKFAGIIENLSLTGAAVINATGDANANILTGNSAANFLNGNGGTDTLIGGDGGDTYIVDSADDVIKETNALAIGGIDLVQSSVDFDLSINSDENIRSNIEKLTLTGTAISATGNALANTLTGNAGANILDGGLGIDTLIGGLGNDTYNVDLTATGALQDTVTEGVSIADTEDRLNLRGSSSNLTAVTLTLGANLEILDASATGISKLNLTGNALNNTLIGNNAANYLLDSTGNDTLNGGAGNDTLDGGIGADSLIGGTGDDTYLVDIIATTTGVAPAPIIITGATLQDSIDETNGTINGIDTLKLRGSVVIPAATAASNIALTGSLANIENLDISLTGATRLDLTGNAANNNLVGNAANNVINGGLGNDILTGGAGNDIYVVDNAGDVVTELLNAGIDTVQSSITYSLFDTDGAGLNGGNVENLTLTGADNINGTGNAFNNVMIGNTGANVLDGLVGSDSLFGGDGSDTLYGGIGLDTLDGGAGADSMDGGDGADTYIVDNAGDTVTETNAVTATGGIDLVKSAISFDLSLKGLNVENLTLTNNIDLNGGTATINATGNALANTLTGNAGNNTLDGGLGIDTLIGGLGNDTYIVDLTATGALQDTVTEGLSVADTADKLKLRGSSSNLAAVTLTLGANLEILDAGDTALSKLNLTGNTLNNTLTGNDVNNVLNGGTAGNDTLNGGLGNDTLIGGTGNDTFVFNAIGTNNVDNISDFVNSQDKINLSGAVFSSALSAGIFIDMFVTGTSALDANDFIIYNKITGELFFDADGNQAGAQELIAKLTPNTNLLQSDFIGAISSVPLVLNGTALSDTLTGGYGSDTITGGAGNDTLFGGAGNDWIEGGDDIDTLYGESGNDYLWGGNWFDVLNGGLGDDTLDGGIGFGTDDWDIADYSDSLSGVSVNLMIAGAQNTGGAGIDTLISIEGIIGSQFNDHLTGKNGSNTLRPGEGNDTVIGGNGLDEIIDGGGNDYIDGGAGYNILIYDWVTSELIVNLSTLTAQNTIGGGVDTIINIQDIRGSIYYTNNIVGNSSNNRISSGNANDSLNGGGGNDTLDGGGGNDQIYGDTGDDSLSGSYGNDTIYGGDGNDYIIGFDGNFVMDINLTDSNYLVGGNGDDSVGGGYGNDTIDGGSGLNTLSGGRGSDVFVFNLIKAEMDFISDFSFSSDGALDVIDLSGIDANTTLNGNQGFNFIGNNVSFSGISGELMFNSGILYGDVNGDAVADINILMNYNVLSMSAADFFL